MKPVRWLRALFRRKRLDAEMSEELQAHLEMQAAENERRGMAPEEARYAALRAFGGVEQVKERARDQRAFVWLEQLRQDVRYAARQLRRNRAFTTFAALSLGLGLGVNVIVFSLVNAVVFRPLPGVRAPEELVYRHPMFGSGIPYPEYVFCRERNSVFSAMAASAECVMQPTLVDPASPAAPGAGEVERVGHILLVSGNYFSALGADVELGRTFLPEEDVAPGRNPVVILSHLYWQVRFNGDPRIVGRILKINQVAFTVIGVARETFPMEPGMLRNPMLWMPLAMSDVVEPGLDRLHAHQDGRTRVYPFGRLQPGKSFGQAQAELLRLSDDYAREFLPPNPRRFSWALVLSHGWAFLPWDKPEIKLMVAGLLLLSGIVLCVACANLANLLLARATARQREISVRLALGASRGRVVRQLLTESVLLALLGGGVALVLGMWCGELLWPWLLGLNPALRYFFSIDWHMTAYAFGLAGGTGMIFGLMPAVEAARTSVHAALKQEGSMLGQRVSRTRLRRGLISGQVAVSVVFLILAALAMRMVVHTTTSRIAFDPKRVWLFEEATPPGTYGARHPQEFQRDLLARVRALPGVESAALGDVWYGREVSPHTLLVDGQQPIAPVTIYESLVAPEFFPMVGVPVMRGRVFTAAEAQGHAPVFVVSESFAAHFWPNADPLGRHIRLGPKRVEGEVIGVVGDGARTIRDQYEFRAFGGELYSPLWPDSSDLFEVWVRTRDDSDAIARLVTLAARQVDGDAQLRPRGSLHQLHEEWRRRTLVVTALVATLGGLALLLAAMGVFGVMSYAVAQRTHEIGVRMALGAERRAIARLILLEGLRLVGWGLAVGALGCAATAWFARALLYGLSPFDPVAFGGVAVLLTAVALLACWFPARRAATVDPMVALRVE